MKSEDIDWKILRGAIIVFVLSITISGSMAYGAWYFQRQMQLEFNRANAAFHTISNRYLAVDEEEKLIRGYLPRFVELYQNGVIGNEQRLNWIEVLRAVGDEIKLPSLSYQIDTQQIYTPAFPLTLGRYGLYSSKMLLSMQLLHEGDLFRVLEKLNEDAKGSYSVSNCTINQSTDEISNEPDAGNITVRCELEWYTIRLSDGTEIKV